VSDERNPGVVQVIEAYENEREISIVMEYIDGIILYEWIRKNKEQG